MADAAPTFYAHHEASETTVRIPLPSAPPTVDWLIAQFKAHAPQLAGRRLKLSLDGETVVQDNVAVMQHLKPKCDVFVLDATEEAPPQTGGGADDRAEICPRSGKHRELYVHVFNSRHEEEPFITTRKRYLPDVVQADWLTSVFTPAAIDALRRTGDRVTVEFVPQGADGTPVEWTDGRLPCYPVGGDVFVYGNPSMPTGAPAVNTDPQAVPVASAAVPPKPKKAAEEKPKPKESTVAVLLRKTQPMEQARRFAEAGRQWEAAIKAAPTPAESIELRRELAAMWLERAKVPQRAVALLEPLKEETEDDYPAEHARCLVGLGKAYFALEKFTQAGDALLLAMQFMHKNNVSASAEVQKDVKLHLGAALFRQGRDEGIKLIQEALNGDIEYTEGVMWMSKAYAVKGHPDDALQWAVQLVVRDQKNTELKKNFVEIAASLPDAIERLDKKVFVVKTSKDIANAWSYLGLAARDFSHMQLAEALFAKGLEVGPNKIDIALNYSHIFEQQARPVESLNVLLKFMRANRDLKVDGVPVVEEFLPLLETAFERVSRSTELALHDEVIRIKSKDDDTVLVLPPTPENVAHPMGSSLGYDPPNSTRAKGVAPGRRELDEVELGVLGMCMTAVKLLFTMGRLDLIPPLFTVVEKCRRFEKLSRTMMRNEHAYYTTTSLVMQYLNAPGFDDPRPVMRNPSPTEGKLYVLSDSNSLPMSWQLINLGGVPTVTVNRLVTGLKIWHTRPESTFYPKANFEAVVNSIPEGADALFCFGEIDCREGVLGSVEKGYHPDARSCMAELIRIYAERLTAVRKARKLRRVFVLAPLPVLDATRHIVVAFNQYLTFALSKVPGLMVVDTTDDVLGEPSEANGYPFEVVKQAGEGRVVRAEFALDSTHINPHFVKKLLEPALNKALERGPAA